MVFDSLRRRISRLAPPPVIKSRWKWMQRQALSRWVRIPTTVTLHSGERYHLSSDLLTDRIIEETFGYYAPLYFPNDLAINSPNDWVVDIGAHHGVYTISMLHRFPGSKAIAIEPAPDAVKALKRNIALNGMTNRVEVISAAIGNRCESASLLISDEGSWANRLVTCDEGKNSVRVNVITLDVILQGRSVSVLKTNCEGGEFAIIPQLVASSCRPMLVTLLAHSDAGDCDALVNTLTNAGYDCKEVCSSKSQPRWVCRLTHWPERESNG